MHIPWQFSPPQYKKKMPQRKFLCQQAFLLFDFELFIGGRSALHAHHLGSTGMYMAVGSVLDDFFIDGKAANLV